MKKSLSLLSLVVALAGGAAGATGTTAGTSITNTATISFSDDTGTAQPPVNSNTVTTTVLPVPSFTITPNQTTPGTQPIDAPDYSRPGQTRTAKPGDIVAYPYVLTNTGNVTGESYDLSTPSVGGTGTGLTPAGVRYYASNPDANNDGVVTPAELAAVTAITTISGVAQDASATFYQVYTVPVTAADAQTFGSSPTGTRRVNPAAGGEPAAPFAQPTDSNNANLTTVTRADAVAIGPKSYPDGNAPAGTTSPSVDPTPVTVTESGDAQSAPATVTTTRITFTNTVRNPGNRADVFDITTLPTALPSGAVSRLLDGTGAVLTDTDGDGVPDVGSLAPGATRDIRIEVTLPAGSTTPTVQPTVTVTATSSNDTTKKDTTTDTVLLPGAAFGDKTTPTGEPAPANVVNQNAAPPANGGNPTTSTPNVLTGIPMQIKNTGGTAEPFVPAGTITFSTPNGPVTKPVSYLPDANCDGVPDSTTPITVTPSIAPGASYCLVPVVDVPDNAYPGASTLNQSATGTISGVKATDTNDTVTVPRIGTPESYITKSVDKASAKPGETLTYSITAINKANANIRDVVVSDVLPANTTFVSVAVVGNVAAPAKVLYRTGGTGLWTAVAPTALAPAVKLEIGLDTNNDNTIDGLDVLRPGDKFDVTFKVSVN